MRRTAPIAALGLALAACAPLHISTYKPKHRVYEATPSSAPQPANSPGSLWRRGSVASMLYTDARALREGDLVVVKVEEVADAQRSTATDVNHTSDTQAAVNGYLQAANHPNAAQNGVGAGLTASGSAQFHGDGTTGRSERLTATVPAVVKQVLPNGNLFVEGHRVILVNSEEHHFYISGVVRPIDIDQDNSIKSSMIADAEIEFTGQGDLTDNQHQPLLSRFFGWIWPF
jgi:flagellar L-ring protein precursor FlgH